MAGPKVPRIPLIGYSGLLFIIGFIVGVVVNKLLEQMGTEQLGGEIFSGFKWLDLVNIGLPLGLLFVLKKFRAFFIGWAVGAVGTTIIDTVRGAMG